MNELEIMKNPNIYLHNDLVIYGAGNYCSLLLEYIDGLDLRIRYICDKNQELWGKRKKGILITNPAELLSDKDNIIVIIASSYYQDIIQDLYKLHICDNVFTDFALKYSIHYNLNKGYFDDDFVRKYRNKIIMEKIEKKVSVDYSCMHDYYIYFWSRIIKDNPIIIYQVGKVGSKSLLHSIEKYTNKVIQPHVLAFRDEYMDEEYADLYHLMKSSIVSSNDVRIITLVRDPVVRDISHLFEHIEIKYIELYDEFDSDLCNSVVNAIDKYVLNADKLVDWSKLSPYMIHHMIRFSGKGGAMMEWFDRELRNVFDINIFDYPFNKEAGYGIIRKDNINVLVIKLEKLNELNDVVGDFLNIGDFCLDIHNDSKNKPYYYAYKEVLEKIKLPRNYLDLYYNDERLRHFYTFEEIEEMRKKWEIL